jgi:hypothetical protein
MHVSSQYQIPSCFRAKGLTQPRVSSLISFRSTLALTFPGNNEGSKQFPTPGDLGGMALVPSEGMRHGRVRETGLALIEHRLCDSPWNCPFHTLPYLVLGMLQHFLKWRN